ncbi:MAG: 4Fe-4S dicluster domain-containing protein [Deltaproteobacteria bacterium]|nr:4Fe-4S dicluster domain-containing protein [Deltaproteobacteria bacterium]
MIIDENKCVGCGQCMASCTVGSAIFFTRRNDSAVICQVDQEECLECGNCLRVVTCPGEAMSESESIHTYPRSVTKYFSDPRWTHPATQIPGRGTEEVKTNDVTGRIRRGQVGVALEFGRPGLGARFSDVEKVIIKLARLGVHFEENNPLTSLMDPETGHLDPQFLSTRVLSGILEIMIPIEKLDAVLETIREASSQVESVFSLDVICRMDPDGTIPVLDTLDRLGFAYRPNAKVNMGLGRPLFQEDSP